MAAPGAATSKNPRHFDSTPLTIGHRDVNTGKCDRCVPRDLQLAVQVFDNRYRRCRRECRAARPGFPPEFPARVHPRWYRGGRIFDGSGVLLYYGFRSATPSATVLSAIHAVCNTSTD
jgi:hypothetical protein